MCHSMDTFIPSPVQPVPPAAVRPFGDILALVTGTVRSSLPAAVAAHLAGTWGSALSGCQLACPGQADALDALAWPVDRTRPCHGAQGHAAFDDCGKRHGVHRTRWMVADTRAVPTLQALAAWHDRVVLGREVAEPDGLLESLFEALLACRVPCLVVPEACESAPRFSRLAVGWNGGLEAVRALHAALPLLRAAREVHLLDGAACATSPDDRGGHFDPREYLASHGVAAMTYPVDAAPHEAGAALLARCAQVRAELLVMGAYRRVAWRERAFGGATRYILRHSLIPALMHH